MKTEYTIKQALEENLNLIIDNARDLAVIHAGNAERREQYTKFGVVAAVVLMRYHDGVYEGGEQALFDAFLPTCKHLCRAWHRDTALLAEMN